MYLQSMGEDSDRRVWFLYDEIANLQKIPEFNGVLAEGRKFGGCFVIGIQNMPQLINIYGQQVAKAIFDLLNTRFYGRNPSSEVATMVETDLGTQRRREARVQNSYGLDQVRDGISIGKDKVNEPIVDYTEIMRLSNLKFYVRMPADDIPVVKLALKYKPYAKKHPNMIARNIKDALSPQLEKRCGKLSGKPKKPAWRSRPATNLMSALPHHRRKRRRYSSRRRIYRLRTRTPLLPRNRSQYRLLLKDRHRLSR